MCSLKHEAKCRVPSSVAEEAAKKGNLLKSAGKKTGYDTEVRKWISIKGTVAVVVMQTHYASGERGLLFKSFSRPPFSPSFPPSSSSVSFTTFFKPPSSPSHWPPAKRNVARGKKF